MRWLSGTWNTALSLAAAQGTAYVKHGRWVQSRLGGVHSVVRGVRRREAVERLGARSLLLHERRSQESL